MIRLILAALLILTLTACDDKPNPGTYPCDSKIAPCSQAAH